jgi:hypothetical protein
MLTLAQFRARFPEFERLPDATLTDALARGLVQTSTIVFGDISDEATGYLAAHFLALSPYGQQARLSAVDGTTTYMTHWRRIAAMRSVGRSRVTG